MSQGESGRELFQRWQVGDQTAARKLFERYAEQLAQLVERRLDERLRRRVDPEDVVQSAFRSFFRRAAAGGYRIDHSGVLWRLLVQITLNKIRRQAEYHRAAKRDVGIEVSLGRLPANAEAVANGPTPEQAAEVLDELEALLERFDPVEVDIITLTLQGYSRQEVAGQVGCSRWTVRRVLDRAGWCLRQQVGAKSG